jgi:hypothetical protein
MDEYETEKIKVTEFTNLDEKKIPRSEHEKNRVSANSQTMRGW